MIDINNPHQMCFALVELQLKEFKVFHNVAQKTGWIRLAAPVVGIKFTLMSVTIAISLIVEPIFKGLVHIVVSPFSSHCEPIKGIKLLLAAPVIGLVCGGIVLALALPASAVITIGMIAAPEGFSKWAIDDTTKVLNDGRKHFPKQEVK